MQFEKSETISKLAEALSKAQSEMDSAKKDSINPHFKSKYADLASVIDAIRPIYKYGLSYVQTLKGKTLLTVLMHTSGEWISSELELIIQKNDMQGLGSALTYARRYSLSSMMGIAQDDDDGEGSFTRPVLKKLEKPSFKIGQSEIETIQSLSNKALWNMANVSVYIQDTFKKKSVDMNEEEYMMLCNHLMKQIKLEKEVGDRKEGEGDNSLKKGSHLM